MKTLTPDEYSKIVDKIIATKKPVSEQLVDLLEAVGNCKVITMDNGGRGCKSLHDPSKGEATADVLLKK